MCIVPLSWRSRKARLAPWTYLVAGMTAIAIEWSGQCRTVDVALVWPIYREIFPGTCI